MKHVRSDPQTRPSKTSLFALYGSVLLVGAVVMVVEILGTRIIGPVFGVNLFVWSALLTVTLCALALGYYSGGILADRVPGARLLGWIVLSAAILLSLALPARGAVLSMGESLGPKAGPLLAATILFGPCLTALGMVCPVVVRLMTDEVAGTGRRVGAVYGISTVGSVAGTLATGFFLIPTLSTSSIVLGAALVLGLVGAIILAANRSKSAGGAVLVPLIAWLGGQEALPPGIVVVHRSQSLYGLIEVVDDNNRGVRFLRSDHSIIGAHWLADRSPSFSFVHVLEMVRFLRPDAQRALQIGLGIGSVPMALSSYGISSDVVDIDPNVVRVAEEYFGFVRTGSVYVEDARTLLRRLPPNQYGLVVHDTFTGGTTPEHLLTVEFLRTTKAVLRPDGVLAVNVPGHHRGERAEVSRLVQRTLRAVFSNVRAFRDMSPDESPDSMANVVFFASDGPLSFSIPANVIFKNPASERTARSVANWEVLREPSSGPLITDERNPLSRLQVADALDHFRAMNELLPRAVWVR
jgi:MFS family permease